MKPSLVLLCRNTAMAHSMEITVSFIDMLHQWNHVVSEYKHNHWQIHLKNATFKFSVSNLHIFKIPLASLNLLVEREAASSLLFWSNLVSVHTTPETHSSLMQRLISCFSEKKTDVFFFYTSCWSVYGWYERWWWLLRVETLL